MDDKQKDIGAIWIKQARNGSEFLSISIGEDRYVAFKNRKTKDNQPDYRILPSNSDYKKPEQREEPRQNQSLIETQAFISDDVPF